MELAATSEAGTALTSRSLRSGRMTLPSESGGSSPGWIAANARTMVLARFGLAVSDPFGLAFVCKLQGADVVWQRLIHLQPAPHLLAFLVAEAEKLEPWELVAYAS